MCRNIRRVKESSCALCAVAFKPFIVELCVIHQRIYLYISIFPHRIGGWKTTWKASENFKTLSAGSGNTDNVWVLGDFNLPMLSWPESSPEMKPDCSHKQVYDFFLSTIADYNFTQVVTEPTRKVIYLICS